MKKKKEKKEILIHEYGEKEEDYVDWNIYRYIRKLPKTELEQFVSAVSRYLQKLTWPNGKEYPKDTICCKKCGEKFESITFHEYMDTYNYCWNHHWASTFDLFVDKTARQFLNEHGKKYEEKDIMSFLEGKKFVCKYCRKEFTANRKRKFCNQNCSKAYQRARYHSNTEKLKRAAKKDAKKRAKMLKIENR